MIDDCEYYAYTKGLIEYVVQGLAKEEKKKKR